MLPREVISTGSLLLRPPADGDVQDIVRAFDDPETGRFLPLTPLPYRAEDAVEYLKAAQVKWEGGGAEFAITEGGRYVGSIGVRAPDQWGVTEIGYLVAPWARGRGVAATATRALTDWLFDRGVRRVELQAEVENVASLRVAVKSGFREEGRRREVKLLRDGRYADLITFGRLAHDPGDAEEPYLPFFADGQLTDGVVRLTPMTVDDAVPFNAMMAEEAVAAYSVGPAGTLDDHVRRCRNTGYWWLSGQRIELAIRDAATDAFAGHVQLMQVAPVLGQAMIGYSLVSAYRGRGFMTRAVNLLVDWTFANTALHRVVAGTDESNTASHAVLERAGFTRECRHRQLLPRPDGTRADDIEWLRLRPA
ncbi:GNAT family N-acetyltransferase [Nonomuraea sp. NN258]|uniref:GNAT family N-acetyltransferase n=1 Tax=Nonomuraea antri TaxID=2730852 RepID=UPI001569AB01|nr:GNAT family N-acetyltransferase [Nonomuraea antri]NRQ35205.1 GNAT family N-acetyltransferase [Nonomuraea antri]